jgi:hypothetical protein
VCSSDLPKQLRWILSILVVIYVSGVIVRHFYGIAVTITNHSRGTLRDVSVKVERRGSRKLIPELAPGANWRVYVEAVGESSINLYFKDSTGMQHNVLLAGYVESGYIGNASAEVMPDLNVKAHDDTFRIVYWKSWFEFL